MFKIGDIVQCIVSEGGYKEGELYQVTAIKYSDRTINTVALKNEKDINGWYFNKFILVKKPTVSHLPDFL